MILDGFYLQIKKIFDAQNSKLDTLLSKSVVKSIQRGVLLKSSPLTVVHSSVNKNKSIILLHGMNSSSHIPYINERTDTSFTLKLTEYGGTTMHIDSRGGISWQLIEFN